MTDPCDSSTEPLSRRMIAKASPVLRLEADIHGGDWRWLTHVETTLERTCAAVVAEAAPRDRSLAADLALMDDVGVRGLNRDWRGQDKPTNVLSFPAPDAASGRHEIRLLGDIVMAEETLLAEAVASGIPPLHHFQHLLVHGLLHLLGHDHEDDAEATIMEALETRILASLGIPDPYAGTEPAAPPG